MLQIRVGFFGGRYSQSDFVKRNRLTRVNYIVLATMIPAVQLTLIYVDALSGQISLVLNYGVLMIFLFLTISFVVTSSMLAYQLKLYFGSHYETQRISIVAALVLTLLSLLSLNARYLVECLYFHKMIHLGEDISLHGGLALIMFSDFLPFLTQIASMWLAAKHKWEDLATAHLENPVPDRSTEAGSNMLGQLREDLTFQEIM